MATAPGDNRPRRTTGAVAPAQVQKKPSGAAPAAAAKISARIGAQKPAAPVSARLVPQAKVPAAVSRPVPPAAKVVPAAPREVSKQPPPIKPAAVAAPAAPKLAPRPAVAPAAAVPQIQKPVVAAKVEAPAPPAVPPTPAPVEPAANVAVVEKLKADAADVITSTQLPPAIKRKQSTHRLAEKIAENLPAPASDSAARPAAPGGPAAPNARFWKMAAAFLAAGCVVLMAASGYLYFGRDASIAPRANAATNSDEPQTAPQTKQDPAVAVQPEPAPAADAGTPINLLRGATGGGCEHPERLTDGESSNYDNSTGYAHYEMAQGTKWKNGMTVTLQKPVKLSRIRFLLFDKDDRTYRYIAEITPDGKRWKPVSEDKKPHRSWQEIRFEAQDVLAVRIKGIDNSKNSGFHVIEIEGYGAVTAAPKRAPPAGYVSELALKPGLWAQYFDGVGNYPTINDVPTFCRVEPTVAFSYGQGFVQSAQHWPMGGACAATFSGFIKVEQEALHTFFIESDDGSRLYINGELVADNDGTHTMTELWGQIDLKPGLHRIWIEYYNVTGPMGLNVSVKPKNSDKKRLDPRQLLHNPAEATRK